MATYTKRSGNNLTTSLSVQYGADKIVKSFSRTYQETSVIKKIVGENDQGQEIVKFNTVSNFEAGTFKDCKLLILCNEGNVTAELYLMMSSWTHGTPDTGGGAGDASEAIHFLLNPNEFLALPSISFLSFQTTTNSAALGATLDNATPDANLYLDSDVNLDGDFEDSETTLQVNDIAPFEVGDLIQIGINTTTATRIEIMEVTAITDDSGTDQDGTGILTVRRALFGTSKADKDSQTDGTNGAVSGANVHFPFFNEYYDHDRALSGSSQLVQTDNRGRWKSRNFFGYGRNDAGNKEAAGLVQGSVAIKFFSKSYQEISFGGTTSNIQITPNTSSKLTASTAYAFDLTLDDSSATTVSFTTDSSNITFGGASGIVSKLNSAIKTLTETTGGGLYGYSCTVAIVDGKLRFTSNSHLAPHDGTNGSKVLLADASSGTNLLSGSAGIFPDDAVVNAPVEPVLPDDTIVDTQTGASFSNINGFMYDNGRGDLIYQGQIVGSITYITGAIQWTIPSLPNAQFVINAAYDSAFSGGIKAGGTVDDNCIASVYGRSVNDKITTTIGTYVFS